MIARVAIRFKLPANDIATTNIKKATLSLYAYDGDGASEVQVQNLLSTWEEDKISWEKLPKIDESITSSKKAVKKGSWIEFDVTKHLKKVYDAGKDHFGFIVKTAEIENSSLVVYSSEASKDTGKRPKLVLEMENTAILTKQSLLKSSFALSMSTHGITIVSNKSNESISLALFNPLGHKVLQYKSAAQKRFHVINTASIASGMYVLKINQKGKSFTQNIVINKK